MPMVYMMAWVRKSARRSVRERSVMLSSAGFGGRLEVLPRERSKMWVGLPDAMASASIDMLSEVTMTSSAMPRIGEEGVLGFGLELGEAVEGVGGSELGFEGLDGGFGCAGAGGDEERAAFGLGHGVGVVAEEGAVLAVEIVGAGVAAEQHGDVRLGEVGEAGLPVPRFGFEPVGVDALQGQLVVEDVGLLAAGGIAAW